MAKHVSVQQFVQAARAKGCLVRWQEAKATLFAARALQQLGIAQLTIDHVSRIPLRIPLIVIMFAGLLCTSSHAA